MLGKLADGIAVEGMEAFAPALAERMELLLDQVPAGGCVLACDPERIRTRAGELVRTSEEFLQASWVNAAAGGQAPIDLGESAFRPITEVRASANRLGLPWWTITPFGAGDAADDADAGQPAQAAPEGTEAERAEPGGAEAEQAQPAPAEPGDRDSRRQVFVTGASPAEVYRGDTARVFADVGRWLADGWRVVLVTEGHGPAQRLTELLRGEGFGARLADLDDPPEPGVPYVSTGLIGHGFTWPEAMLAVLTEGDLAGQRRRRPGDGPDAEQAPRRYRPA